MSEAKDEARCRCAHGHGVSVKITGEERDVALAALALQLDLALQTLALGGVPAAPAGVQALGCHQVRQVAEQLRAMTGAEVQVCRGGELPQPKRGG